MPKKSTKSKSKRTTLKQKYKVIRKVREHHKKSARRRSIETIGHKAQGTARDEPGRASAWRIRMN